MSFKHETIKSVCDHYILTLYPSNQV